MHSDKALVDFTRRLRQAGITVGPMHTTTLVSALEAVGASAAEDVYWAFRNLSISRHDQIPVFNKVFMEVFGNRAPPALSIVGPVASRTWSISRGEADGAGDGETEAVATTTGASGLERLSTKDFSELTDEEEAQVRRLIAQMAWKPADTFSRRRRPSRTGDRPDLRRTLRNSIGWEGDLMRIATTRRATRRRPMIFIADVSGSMERYSEMLLYFAHSAQDRLGRIEAFVFSTRLTRITRELDRRKPAEAIARVADAVHDWSGGTRIGESLHTFNREWSRRVTRGGAIALLVSDGWERGDPAQLAAEMATLRRSVHRVIWLNPLAGQDGFRPETRGMRAALPHVDHFLAAGNLDNLEDLVGLLETIGRR